MMDVADPLCRHEPMVNVTRVYFTDDRVLTIVQSRTSTGTQTFGPHVIVLRRIL